MQNSTCPHTLGPKQHTTSKNTHRFLLFLRPGGGGAGPHGLQTRAARAPGAVTHIECTHMLLELLVCQGKEEGTVAPAPATCPTQHTCTHKTHKHTRRAAPLRTSCFRCWSRPAPAATCPTTRTLTPPRRTCCAAAGTLSTWRCLRRMIQPRPTASRCVYTWTACKWECLGSLKWYCYCVIGGIHPHCNGGVSLFKHKLHNPCSGQHGSGGTGGLPGGQGRRAGVL